MINLETETCIMIYVFIEYGNAYDPFSTFRECFKTWYFTFIMKSAML